MPGYGEDERDFVDEMLDGSEEEPEYGTDTHLPMMAEVGYDTHIPMVEADDVPGVQSQGRDMRVRAMSAKMMQKHPNLTSMLLTNRSGKQLLLVRKER